jgi:DNA polymerase elongation subunit (family B)
MQKITNLRYNHVTRNIYLKLYQDLELSVEPWNGVFYSKYRAIPGGKGYKIENCDKKFFFTKERVDKVTILDFNGYTFFKKYAEKNKKLLYQYDLSLEYQYMIYNNLSFSEDYTVAYLDIENRDDLNAEEAKSSILMISVIINGVARVFDLINYSTEEDMISAFFDWFLNMSFPDVVLGWNVVNFDKQYIVNRAARLGIVYDEFRFSMIEFINMSDIMLKKFGYAILKDTGGLSLDKVSNFFLGEGKKSLPASVGKMYDIDHQAVLEYNLVDLILLEELDNKLQFFEFLKRIQSLSQVRIRDTFWESIVIDSMILRRYSNFVFPTKEDNDNAIEYEGGFVFQPPKGLFSNVSIIDFSAMYPSIILTFNISPDSKDNDSPDYRIGNVGFKSDPQGIFKETIKHLFTERLKLKAELKELEKTSANSKESINYKNLDTLQAAYKTILNSFYGVCAFKKFRLYDLDLAKSITLMGRTLLHEIKKRIEETGLGTVLYGDTDSEMCQFNVEPSIAVEAINYIFLPDYVSSFGITDNFLKVELADSYKQMIFFGKKKKYIGRKEDGKFYIKGFDTEKYDVPKQIRTMMKDIITNLLDGKPIVVDDYRQQIDKFNLIDYAILKKFNKNPEDYAVMPQHLRALNWSKKYNLLTDEAIVSRMVRLLFIKVDESLGFEKTDVMVLDEKMEKLPAGIELDFDKYFYFFIIQKMKILYDIFDVKYDHIVKPKPVAKISKVPKEPKEPKEKKPRRKAKTDESKNLSKSEEKVGF